MSQVTSAAPPTAVGRRERKKQETRRALKRAALRLALEHGVERLTVEEITAAADVSPRTFFNYFACKEDALIAQTDAVNAELHAGILARPTDEAPLTALHAAVAESEILRDAHANRDQALERQRLVHAHPTLRARQVSQTVALENAVAEAMAQRLQIDPDDPTARLLGVLASGTLRVALRRWAAEGTRLETLVDDAFARLPALLDIPLPGND